MQIEFDPSKRLETLLRNQRHSGTGLSFIAQGTPTNNTESNDSGHSSIDDPDASFDAAKAGPVEIEADPRRRREGVPLLEKKFRGNLARRYAKKQLDAVYALMTDQKKLEATPVNEFMDLLAG